MFRYVEAVMYHVYTIFRWNVTCVGAAFDWNSANPDRIYCKCEKRFGKQFFVLRLYIKRLGNVRGVSNIKVVVPNDY